MDGIRDVDGDIRNEVVLDDDEGNTDEYDDGEYDDDNDNIYDDGHADEDDVDVDADVDDTVTSFIIRHSYNSPCPKFQRFPKILKKCFPAKSQ